MTGSLEQKSAEHCSGDIWSHCDDAMVDEEDRWPIPKARQRTACHVQAS